MKEEELISSKCNSYSYSNCSNFSTRFSQSSQQSFCPAQSDDIGSKNTSVKSFFTLNNIDSRIEITNLSDKIIDNNILFNGKSQSINSEMLSQTQSTNYTKVYSKNILKTNSALITSNTLSFDNRKYNENLLNDQKITQNSTINLIHFDHINQNIKTSLLNSNINNFGKQYRAKYKDYIPLEKDFIIKSQEKNNHLIFILNSIILTITHFCRTTFHIINSIRGSSSKVILNEYYKRYKAYFDCASNMNSELENLNIIVNYICEYITSKGYLTSEFNNKYGILGVSQPKFSIFRLFVSLNYNFNNFNKIIYFCR